MSENWPGTTGLPQNGTHRVVTGIRAVRDTWEYLKAPTEPDYPDYLPQWTPYAIEAGAWTKADAEQLAEMHRTHSSTPITAWIEQVPPRDFRSRVQTQPPRPERKRR